MLNFKPVAEPVKLETDGQTITWGDTKQWNLFAGPDILEDEGLILEVASELKRITDNLGIPWIFKCSYDKANRQSIHSFRGPGLKEGLKSFEKLKAKVGCAILSDIHTAEEAAPAAEVLDVIQIPAFLSRQTDLIVAAAKTDKVLHIKKGQFMSPWAMKNVVTKAKEAGNERVLLCERGTFYGYQRLVNDFVGLEEMRALGKPVIFDVSHSTHLYGASADDKSSGGRSELSWPLARAALAFGVDGIFCETHPSPDKALCDGPSSYPLKEIETMLKSLQKVWQSHSSD